MENRVSLRTWGKEGAWLWLQWERCIFLSQTNRGKDPGIFMEAIKTGWDPHCALLVKSVFFRLWMWGWVKTFWVHFEPWGGRPFACLMVVAHKPHRVMRWKQHSLPQQIFCWTGEGNKTMSTAFLLSSLQSSFASLCHCGCVKPQILHWKHIWDVGGGSAVDTGSCHVRSGIRSLL